MGRQYGIKANEVQIKGLEGAIAFLSGATGNISGRIYVSAGADPPGTPMSVFVEMGTGPQGRDNAMGENGRARYPLPGSAYTQEPWIYRGEDGKFHRSSGMKPRPYIWPAIQKAMPYAAQYISDGVKTAAASGETVQQGLIRGMTRFLNAVKSQAKLFCDDGVRRNAITTEVNGREVGGNG